MAPREEDDVLETQPLVRQKDADAEEGDVRGASSPDGERGASTSAGGGAVGASTSAAGGAVGSASAEGGAAGEGEEGGVGECRICGDEDAVVNLEVPCACSGSVKYAHHKCIQRWCDEKRDTICEMCLTPFRGDYHAGRTAEDDAAAAAPPPGAFLFAPRLAPRRTADGRYTIEILHDGGVHQQDEYVEDNSPSARFRSVAMLVLGLLLIRHLLFGLSGAGSASSSSSSGGDDSEAMFSLMFLRMLVLMLPFVVMVRLLTVMRRAREAEESRVEIVNALMRAGRAAPRGPVVLDGGRRGRSEVV